ncbi:MAG TPA: Uma2 family endonuclease [Candidatus Xenobia bacterium]
MAETDLHRDQMIGLILALQDHFRDREDVYVTGNLLMFYEEGSKHRHLSPDVMAVFGIPKHERDDYLMWEEGKAPDAVVEITSKSTRAEDLGHKKELYRAHGVREYYIFDPLREYLPAQLQGYRLVGGEYILRRGTRRLVSRVLGLELRVVNDVLRLYDPKSDRLLPVPAEVFQQWRQERQRADTERQRAEAERQRAEEATQRVVELERRLRELEGA